VNERNLHATIGNPFGAQARTTNDMYISSSSNFNERNKIIELIHPERPVVGMMSLIVGQSVCAMHRVLYATAGSNRCQLADPQHADVFIASKNFRRFGISSFVTENRSL